MDINKIIDTVLVESFKSEAVKVSTKTLTRDDLTNSAKKAGIPLDDVYKKLLASKSKIETKIVKSKIERIEQLSSIAPHPGFVDIQISGFGDPSKSGEMVFIRIQKNKDKLKASTIVEGSKTKKVLALDGVKFRSKSGNSDKIVKYVIDASKALVDAMINNT